MLTKEKILAIIEEQPVVINWMLRNYKVWWVCPQHFNVRMIRDSNSGYESCIWLSKDESSFIQCKSAPVDDDKILSLNKTSIKIASSNLIKMGSLHLTEQDFRQQLGTLNYTDRT